MRALTSLIINSFNNIDEIDLHSELGMLFFQIMK
jgi:hypothetical protein